VALIDVRVPQVIRVEERLDFAQERAGHGHVAGLKRRVNLVKVEKQLGTAPFFLFEAFLD